MPVDLAPELLEILACPNCHSALAVDDERDELVCVASDCGLAYPVVDGIPVMLVDEARRPGMPGDASADAVPSDDIPSDDIPSDDIPSDDIDLSSGSDNASSDSADPGPASPGSASTGPATSGQ